MHEGRVDFCGQRVSNKPKLLVNENIPLRSVRALRNDGYDVISISERSPGISDENVLQIACADNRIIVTFDRDYGELIFRRKLPIPAGILYLRFRPVNPDEVAEYISRLINNGVTLEGMFSTADRSRIRQIALQHLIR